MQLLTCSVRRYLVGVSGAGLAVAAATLLYGFVGQAYYNFYVYPKVKGHYVLSLDWRNTLVITAILLVIYILSFGSYRLIRYAVWIQNARGR